MTAREPGAAFDFRNNRGVRPQSCFLCNGSSERRTQNAFKSPGLSYRQVSSGVEEGQVGADAGSGRRSIQCAIGKDARMPDVHSRRLRRADKDRAVEIAEFRLRRVSDGTFGRDGLFDGEAQGLKSRRVFGPEVEAQGLRLAKGIERSAKRQIIVNRADARNVNRLLHVEDERRHVAKRDASNLAFVDGRLRRHKAAGGVKPDRGVRNGSGKQSLFQHDGREPDDPVSAHRAVAFIMKEQHPGIGLRMRGGDQQASVHLVVTSRFPHERRAKMVEVRPAIVSFFQDGGAGGLGKPRRHHAKRFSGHVTVKGGDNVHGSPLISGRPALPHLPSLYKGEEKRRRFANKRAFTKCCVRS